MKVLEAKKVAVDGLKREEIYMQEILWEDKKETADEFLEQVKFLHPDKEIHIMHKAVRVFFRKKLPEKDIFDDEFTTDLALAKRGKRKNP